MAKNTVWSYLDIHNYPKTRIMATLGANNYQKDQLEDMLEAGASVFRFNAARFKKTPTGQVVFDFDSNPPVDNVLQHIRELSVERFQPIPAFLDLAGPKGRVKAILSFPRGASENARPNHPQKNQEVILFAEPREWEEGSAAWKRIGRRGGDAAELRSFLQTLESNPAHASSREHWPFDFAGLERLKKKELQAYRRKILQSEADDTWRLVTNLSSFDRETFTGGKVFLKDGKCTLKVHEKERSKDFVRCVVSEVSEDFVFATTQGVNPQFYIFPEVFTGEDRFYLEWALNQGIDIVSMSFVCSPHEYFQIQQCVLKHPQASQTPTFAKFETAFSVEPEQAQKFLKNKTLLERTEYSCREDWGFDRYRELIELYRESPIEAICEAFDGAMVARGDLAVEADKYLVPFYQKQIVEAGRLRNKPVIVATEVLESMKEGRSSTRAEIGDISTAVREEADIIMLAGEVASGKANPGHVVAELKKAIRKAEAFLLVSDRDKDLQSLLWKFEDRHKPISVKPEQPRAAEWDLAHSRRILETPPADPLETMRIKIGMGGRVCIAARAKNSPAIFVTVTTGETAKYIAYFRPAQIIIAITDDPQVAASRLLLTRGIYPVVIRQKFNRQLGDFIQIAREIQATLRIVPGGGPGWAPAAAVDRHSNTFILPGLLRIEPEAAIRSASQRKGERSVVSHQPVPNTVHEFQLPADPQRPPEIETKYVFAEPHYDHLFAFLREAARRRADPVPHPVVQQNFYFVDENDVVSNMKAMVRVRIESHDGEPRRVLFTFKKASSKVESSDAEQRPEREYDIKSNWENGKNGMRDINQWLPSYLKRMLLEAYPNEFRQKGITNPQDIKLLPKAGNQNQRLAVEVENGLNLELDRFEVTDAVYYELEVETQKSQLAMLEEFITLLFESKKIPRITQYPSKYVRTLYHHGLLAEAQQEVVKKRLGEVESQLKRWGAGS